MTTIKIQRMLTCYLPSFRPPRLEAMAGRGGAWSGPRSPGEARPARPDPLSAVRNSLNLGLVLLGGCSSALAARGDLLCVRAAL
jgi:hypothetical protein